jgi:predicted nucleotidyltransferase
MYPNFDKAIIVDLCNREQISYLGLFGSVARGEQSTSSDVDLLIDFPQVKSFFELGKIQDKLEKILNKQVDLVLKNNIKTDLKVSILKDAITLYEKK